MFNTILSLGIIAVLGLLSAKVINKMKLPAITGYILAGIILGPYVLNFISEEILHSSSLISSIALSFVAFSLGENFKYSQLKRIGKSAFAISIGEVIGAFLLVLISMYFIVKTPLYVALIIGAIAPATAPAAILMVVREYKARGIFAETLLGVVALDDAWGIILFSFILAISSTISGNANANIFREVLHGFIEVFGSLLLGFVMGLVFRYFVKFIRMSGNMLIFTVGFILVTGGISEQLGLSVLLSNMMLGATIANFARTSRRSFDVLSRFDPPIYLLFFVLAGASFKIGSFGELGFIGLVYIFTRLPGEMIGAYLGAVISGARGSVKKYIGLGLAPQAGVAIGLALMAKGYIPGDAGNLILNTIIITTIIYEIIGPPLVKIALAKSGSINI